MNRKKLLTICPVCGEGLEVTELRCKGCATTMRGRFQVCEFCTLERENMNFLRIFLRARGNISEVAKRLGISHPTARQRLRDLLKSLGYEVRDVVEEEDEHDVLTLLEKGEINVDEAIELLRGRYGHG